MEVGAVACVVVVVAVVVVDGRVVVPGESYRNCTTESVQ